MILKGVLESWPERLLSVSDNLTVIVICFSPDLPPRIETPPSRVKGSISAEGLNLLKDVLDC